MITHRDKVLPLQPFFTSAYVGASYPDALAGLVHDYASARTRALDLVPHPRGEELSSPAPVVGLLVFLATMLRATRVLEVGTFDGRTALALAATGARVTTVEIGCDFATLARENFARDEFGDRVTLINDNAFVALDTLKGLYDLIFIDAAKQDYPALAAKAERVLARPGVIVIDDVFFHGDALNAQPATDKGRGCRAVLERYRDHPWLRACLLPLGNGLLMLVN